MGRVGGDVDGRAHLRFSIRSFGSFDGTTLAKLQVYMDNLFQYPLFRII